MIQDRSVTYHNVKPSRKLYGLFLKYNLHNGMWGCAKSLFEHRGNVKTFRYADAFCLKKVKYVTISVHKQKIIGWSLYIESANPHIRDAVWAFVDPDYRLQGIGKEMVRRVTKQAGNRNVTTDDGNNKKRFWNRALGVS